VIVQSSHKLLCCTFALVFFLGVFPAECFCQRDESIVISSAPSPVGSGARAAGIGSAFIAVADDATAASWNPAGLIQLERAEVSAVGSFYHQQDDIGSVPQDRDFQISAGGNSTDSVDLNFLSVAYPFELLGRNVVVSANYQRQLDFNRDLEFFVEREVPNPEEPMSLTGDVQMKQQGGLAAVSPSLAVEIIPTLSVGVAVNFWIDQLYLDYSWKRETTLKSSFGSETLGFIESFTVERDTYKNFFGVNATFGILWNIYRGLSFGCFFESGFSADVDREIFFQTQSDGQVDDPDESAEEIHVDLPKSFGVGLSMRFSDSFMVTADYTRVFWQDFVFRNEAGDEYDVQGRPIDESDIRATNTFRVGGEYLWILDRIVIPLRFGGFYDPQPSQGGSQDYFGFSIGNGVSFRRFTVDWAYQIRIGLNDTESSLLNIIGTGAFEDVPVDVYQHLFLLSTVFRF